jgi:hypothetical protein
MSEKKLDEEMLAQRDRLRDEFDQAGRPGGDFYNWLMLRVDASVAKARAAESKWKGRKWKKKNQS